GSAWRRWGVGLPLPAVTACDLVTSVSAPDAASEPLAASWPDPSSVLARLRRNTRPAYAQIPRLRAKACPADHSACGTDLRDTPYRRKAVGRVRARSRASRRS